MRRLVSYLTFPGVVAHEFAHAWACKRLGLQVHQVCYLRLGNPMGFVRHEASPYALHNTMVAVAPFFVSTLFALLFSLGGCLLTRSPLFPETRDVLAVGALWLGFSCALHAFPSSGDADSLWQDVRSPNVSLLVKLLLIPVVGVIRLGQLGTHLWLDVLFALCVVALPPALLLVMTV